MELQQLIWAISLQHFYFHFFLNIFRAPFAPFGVSLSNNWQCIIRGLSTVQKEKKGQTEID